MFIGNKEEALDLAIDGIRRHGYVMTPEDHLLNLLEELERDGLLLRADRAGDKNPVPNFNDSYAYIAANP